MSEPMTGLLTLDELGELHRRGEIETVICALPDLYGRLVGKRVRTGIFLSVALRDEGLHGSLAVLCLDMDMEPRQSFALSGWRDGFRDFRFSPDVTTLRKIPWQDKTALVMCDACHEGSDALVEEAPRTILRRQIERAAKLGLATKTATELEFYLFQGSLDEAWRTRYANLVPTSRYRSDYHIFQGTLQERFTRDARESLSGAGLEIESSKPEWGLGQQEISTRYGDPMDVADRHAIFKTGIKEIAVKHGLMATFMAKPFIDDVGSSCHIHVSLCDASNDKPICWSAEAPHHMSGIMAQFLAGSLATSRDLAVTVAPTVNSYKRMQPDSFAPTSIGFGLDNRTCSHRIVGHGSSYRFESRLPGADANAHIAIAGLIAGGMHGVVQKLPPLAAVSGNAYGQKSLQTFPRSLGEAVGLFKASKLAREAFGDAVHDHLTKFYASEDEQFQFHAVTDWERVRYFERV